MHEKTLLYCALGVTAVATVFGVVHASNAKTDGPNLKMDIAPVSLIETSQKGVVGAEVPIKLTASDGTGLKLVALRADAAVEDPLALTELHLTFENPQDRVLEGTFRIGLPQGASLSRFAMKVGDTWQEGEVVEKQQARAAYEDFLHRKQDPALMEQGAGNEFTARVFPIPAHGRKEIVITYSESLQIGQSYTLPLNGLPQLGSLDVTVHVSGKSAADLGGKTDEVYAVHQSNFTPAGDFVVEPRRIPRSPGLRSGDLSITRVIPFATSRPEPLGSAVIMVDTSASRGLGIGDQAKAVQDLLAKLPSDTLVSVALFDQDVVPLYDGKASGFGQKEISTIVARGALGASNFENAIGWAGTEAKKKKATRLVFVTDGVATAGETDSQKLKDKVVENLRGAGITRMDALAIGGIRDDAFLRQVVRGVLDRDGVVLDMKLGAEAIARRLGEATSSGIAVKVDGARWSYPTKLDGLQAGDEVLVYAEADASQPLKIDVGGQAFAPDLRTIERPLVERAWAQAKIQSLLDEPKENAATTKQQIVALSTSHRVLSPYTALLVLENDWDYRRFNIDRTAKIDILTVQDGRVAVTESGRVSDAVIGKREDNVERKKGRGEANPFAGVTATAAAPMASAAPQENAASKAAAATPATPPPEPAPTAKMAPPVMAADGDERQAGDAPRHRAAARPAQPVTADPSPNDGALLQNLAGGSAVPGALGRSDIPAVDLSGAASAAPPSAVAPRGEGFGNGHGRLGGATTGGGGSAGAQGPTASVRTTTLSVDHGISSDEVQRTIRGLIPRYRACYQTALNSDPTTHGALSLRVTIDATGAVKDVSATGGSDAIRSCFSVMTKRTQFAAPGAGNAEFTQGFDLVGGSDDATATNAPDGNGDIPKTLAYEGRFKIVMEDLGRGDKDGALTEANMWHADQPGDILSLVALGEVFEARGDIDQAARAYGSILELFSFRADSRRFAGERLERLQSPKALALAADTFGKAVEERPDHPASHRLYAYALLKEGQYENAFEAMKKGATRTYPTGRFRGVDRILKEDLGLIAAAWIHAQPDRTAEIKTRLHAAGGKDENSPSLRFVLVWETDANDVDFHIHDGKGGHAYYAYPTLPSGGELYADVTTGYGPECFTIRDPHAKSAYPYTLQAHYYSRGPMGYGMGKLEVLEHDGKGNLSFSERPFVVMVDHAYVDMGTVTKDTKLTPITAM